MPKSSRLVIFPGSFDPLTLGHLDIVTRAAGFFDQVEIAIGINESKKSLLEPEERKQVIEEVTKRLKNVTVATFSGLVAEYAVSRKAHALVRGLRQAGDFDYEARMAHANLSLAEGLETIFIAASPEYSSISSTIVRDIYRWGGDVSAFVPAQVNDVLNRRRTGTR
ncbi:MAG: pantetheine-phosphate adenylyltransferase [Rhodothermia bacterium]|nr:pantetheine-phosphate adenylyltransferase [Rhodothermia bacterium]